jgi:hypothetical protein
VKFRKDQEDRDANGDDEGGCSMDVAIGGVDGELPDGRGHQGKKWKVIFGSIRDDIAHLSVTESMLALA